MIKGRMLKIKELKYDYGIKGFSMQKIHRYLIIAFKYYGDILSNSYLKIEKIKNSN
jgi:hypothetical protein